MSEAIRNTNPSCGKRPPASGPPSVRLLQKLVAMALCSFVPAGPSPAQSPQLREIDFRRIGEDGFGDRQNSYAWAMTRFRGKIYVGSNRSFLCTSTLTTSIGSGGPSRIPIECAPDVLDMDLRARIFAFDPATNSVETVFISPTVEILLSDGSRVHVPRDHGYRTMAVYREPDGTEALYVGTRIASIVPGSLSARVLRSVDGMHFEEVPLQLPAGVRFTSLRSLTVYNDRLFVLTVSPIVDVPGLLELDQSPSAGFRGVADSRFGDPANVGAFEMEVFKGFLYVGTFGTSEGFQLLKTRAEGEPPYVFQKVLAQGAYRGVKNQSVVSLAVYKDQLYVGTGVFFGSSAIDPEFKPSAAEMLRVNADDSWELLVGDERQTPDGFKTPLTGFPPGFGNAFAGYMWRMIVHQGILYLGTLDTSVFAQYADGLDISDFTDAAILEKYPALAELVQRVGPDEIADVITAVEGGFDLWATDNGTRWTLVTWTGFGDEFNYGVRNFVSTPYGLFLGTANPFYGFQVYLAQPPGTDSDGDSHADALDNCPFEWNLNQADLDHDGVGDACDRDRDGDCILDELDPDPAVAKSNLQDGDADGVADDCDNDRDGDGVLNHQDNCPAAANFDQRDSDGDGRGDVCQETAGQDVPGDDPDPGADPSGRPTFPTLCGAVGSLFWIFWAGAIMLFSARCMGRERTRHSCCIKAGESRKAPSKWR